MTEYTHQQFRTAHEAWRNGREANPSYQDILVYLKVFIPSNLRDAVSVSYSISRSTGRVDVSFSCPETGAYGKIDLDKFKQNFELEFRKTKRKYFTDGIETNQNSVNMYQKWLDKLNEDEREIVE